jgi:hypothetical protein
VKDGNHDEKDVKGDEERGRIEGQADGQEEKEVKADQP